MELIDWTDFEKIILISGTILEVDAFPEAIKPAYKIIVDLGKYGIKRSSAGITKLYNPADLIGKQVLCVLNFKPKQIGKYFSEVLITGFPDENGNVVLATTERMVPNGTRLW